VQFPFANLTPNTQIYYEICSVLFSLRAICAAIKVMYSHCDGGVGTDSDPSSQACFLYARFEDITVLLLKMLTLCDFTPCRLVNT